ncbi:MAG TPA: hypothetical protein VFL17_21845, partial [Anaerolineae bacterium]|nr:hypothetical protein [Anaerolineae bacterium]
MAVATSAPFLATKLYIPRARPHLVPRPRLIRRLVDGLARPLVLISAPAGFGKTTLMSEWRASEAGRDFPLAWLSLDDDDNDLTRFLAYFVAALRALMPGFGDTALALLQSPQPPLPKAVLTGLINDLSDFDAPFALVLDDYHVITAQPIHGALTFLLDHLPPHIHLVLLTRADPPLPLPRLRARNQLTGIRAADLRFTVDETADFLNRVMALNLSAGDIAALEQRTEGWIAGLQLAALSMQGHDAQGLSDFITAFTGGHHYIADYLAEEVLNRQSDAVRSFLLKTSILDRLTASLCNALTERVDGQTTLEALEQANLFVTPLDDDRGWYRYHHLFADVLRSRLRQAYPDQLPELHRRAAEWYELNGLAYEAIQHLLASSAFQDMARLVEQEAMTKLNRGEVTLLLR